MNKYVKRGIILLIIGLSIFLGIRIFAYNTCLNAPWWNILCYVDFITDFILNSLAWVILIFFALLSLMYLLFIRSSKQQKNLATFGLFLILALLSLFIPDPLPFIDEIFFVLLTLWQGAKTISGG